MAGAAVALAFGLTACGDSSNSASTAAAATTAPALTAQPAAASVAQGQAATFTVTATGTAPLSYQWQRNGAAIPGATSAAYTLNNADLVDSGALFSVVVSNTAGTVTSNAASLIVNATVVAPTLTVQPLALSAQDGTTATLSVAADGTAPFTYAWTRNGTPIVGATDASYTTPALSLADSGAVYQVVVSNAAGSATSGNATLTVTPVAPALTSAPTAVAVQTGQSATFTALASGSAPLAYQWNRNGTAIAGATSASYTTPATAAADDGALYSVSVSNAGGSVTSSAVRLSVSATLQAPAIATAPQGVGLVEGQVATFSASATGTAPLAYQWRRNGVDLAGATAAIYTTPATTVADSGAKYSVRVTNAAGSVVSAEATLTVNAATSGLIGRSWATAQSLETDDNNVTDRDLQMDDAGRATVLFLKTNGTRLVLYATRGTPNGAGAAPTWSTPAAIDTLNGTPVGAMTATTYNFGVNVAPNGNAAAYWFNTAPCTSATYYTGNTCRYIYSARFLASTGQWEAPVLVGDGPSGAIDIAINNAGDIAVRLPGWVRSGTNSYSARVSVAYRAAASPAFSRQTFADATLASPKLGLDAAGNLLLAAQATQNATTDIVAYRGTVGAGFGAATTLDTRGAAATLLNTAVGTGGQQVVIWRQNNGVKDTLYAASSPTPTGAWTNQDLGVNWSSGTLTVADSGNANFYSLNNNARLRWLAGAWGAPESAPANPWSSTDGCAFARSGDFLCVRTDGTWGTYDAGRNVFVQGRVTTSPGAGYVLNFNAGTLGLGTPALSISGYGVVTMQNKYDTLPTPAAPAGDGRTVTNLWGAILK